MNTHELESEDDSDVETLPQFIDHIPNIENYDLQVLCILIYDLHR